MVWIICLFVWYTSTNLWFGQTFTKLYKFKEISNSTTKTIFHFLLLYIFCMNIANHVNAFFLWLFSVCYSKDISEYLRLFSVEFFVSLNNKTFYSIYEFLKLTLNYLGRKANVDVFSPLPHRFLHFDFLSLIDFNSPDTFLIKMQIFAEQRDSSTIFQDRFFPDENFLIESIKTTYFLHLCIIAKCLQNLEAVCIAILLLCLAK